MSIQFEYFYGSQAEQFSFYRIPKMLFSDEAFADISVEAKVLYGFMLDRMCLSVKNCWFDEDNRVYIIYTIDDIIADFGCARQKAAKLLDELEKGIGLIERKRQGLGRPNIIYVKNFIHNPKEKRYENQNSESMNIENQEVLNSNLQKYENHTSRDMKTELQEVPKSYSNNTNNNYTEYNKTDNNDIEIPSYLSLSKVVCQTCGTINSGDGPLDYNFNNNVYSLNPCDHNFFLDFDATTYSQYDEDYHLTTLKRGEYCKFCKGTFARATRGLENHDYSESIDAQLGNNRFFITEKCGNCEHTTSEYVAAKSVVTSYYGNADGEAHSVTVSDLSDSDVHTSIRYGTSADSCTKTSAPSYTKAGYYPIYYKISYKYGGETMTENGVSYVWLLEENSNDNSNGTIIVLPEKHEHDFRYLETVAPSCENLGYERWQCDGCGSLEKRNYTKATGHDYEDITIREANCKQGGLVLTLCKNCGDFHQTTTATGEHKYKTEKHNPTCVLTPKSWTNERLQNYYSSL